MRRLPETDLASMAPLSPDQQVKRFETMVRGWAPYSYQPVRNHSTEILNVAPGPLASVPRAPWKSVARLIRLSCSRPEGVLPNLQVGKALYGFATEAGLVGSRYNLDPLSLGIGTTKLTYWSNIVLNIGGRDCLPFIDPRRGQRLTEAGRRFVLSMMRERLRAYVGDFPNPGFVILQFSSSKAGTRKVQTHFADGIDLWERTELVEMITRTYQIWEEVVLRGQQAVSGHQRKQASRQLELRYSA